METAQDLKGRREAMAVTFWGSFWNPVWWRMSKAYSLSALHPDHWPCWPAAPSLLPETRLQTHRRNKGQSSLKTSSQPHSTILITTPLHNPRSVLETWLTSLLDSFVTLHPPTCPSHLHFSSCSHTCGRSSSSKRYFILKQRVTLPLWQIPEWFTLDL